MNMSPLDVVKKKKHVMSGHVSLFEFDSTLHPFFLYNQHTMFSFPPLPVLALCSLHIHLPYLTSLFSHIMQENRTCGFNSH